MYNSGFHDSVSSKARVPCVARVAREEGLSNIRLFPIIRLMALLATWKGKPQRSAIHYFPECLAKVIGYECVQEGVYTGVHVGQNVRNYLYHYRKWRDFEQGEAFKN